MGQRVRAVMNELHGEKIDIVDFSEDPAEMVGHALSPARVSSVEVVDLAARSARVVVPDYQLSLAIGKEGQNARLAARLTGWRIDIRSDEAPAEPAIDARRTRGPAAWSGAGLTAGSALGPPAARLSGGPQSASPKACADACPPTRSRAACAHASGVGSGPRRASCCESSPVTGARASRSSPILRDGHPAEGRTCTPPPSAWSSPSAVERSPGPSRSEGRLATTAVEDSSSQHTARTDRDRPRRNWSSSS